MSLYIYSYAFYCTYDTMYINIYHYIQKYLIIYNINISILYIYI